MASASLAFANFLLLFQVVYGVFSDYPGEVDPLRDDLIKKLKELRLQSLQDEKINPYFDVDDVYENQIPPPPTEQEYNNYLGGKPEGFFTGEENVLPKTSAESLRTDDEKNNSNEINDDDDSDDPTRNLISFLFRSLLDESDDVDEDNMENKLRKVASLQEHLKKDMSELDGSFDGDREAENNGEEGKRFSFQSGEEGTSNKYRTGTEDLQASNGIQNFRISIKLKNLDSEERPDVPSRPIFTVSSSKDNKNKSVPSNKPSLVLRLESGESGTSGSQESKPIFLMTSTSNNQDENLNKPNSLKIKFLQPSPNSFILLKHLTDVIKEKSAVDALGKGSEKQLSPSRSFVGRSNITPWPNSKLILMRIRQQRPKAHLPPLNFPDGNTALAMHIHLHADSEEFQDDTSGEDNSAPLQRSEIRDEESFPRQPLSECQDLPLLINKILANIVRSAAENSDLQPIPTLSAPKTETESSEENSAKENVPVHFRLVLFPLKTQNK